LTITSTTRTMTTYTSTSPKGTTSTATSDNKSNAISMMLRTQLRTNIRKIRALNSRKDLKKRWDLQTTQNLCTNRLIIGFQTEKKPNHIHILILLFHGLQVSGERLIHVHLLTNDHNLIVVSVHSLCTLLKPKILFTHLINPSDIPGTRVHMTEIILNILGNRKVI